MQNIIIIDYGVGNLFSLSSSLKYLGYDVTVTNKKSDIENASHIILPGVGAFADAAKKLEATGIVPVIKQQASKKPFLGICVGMQLLFEKSFEFGQHSGLGLISGQIYPIKQDLEQNNFDCKVPHMGWNKLNVLKNNNPLMKYTKQDDSVYFVHSFYAKNCDEYVVANVEYGVNIPAVVSKNSIYGCQFHPEKSGKAGLEILRAFANLDV